MLVGIVRTIILYIIVVIVIRLMGKRQIGQLQPFELVIILMISEFATIPSQDTGIPLISGLFPVLVLLLIGVAISEISLKSVKARALICGTPTVVIQQGQILEDQLRKSRYNLSDLLEQLRSKDHPDISEVEYAILETNGQLSVIPKAQKKPVTFESLQLQPPSENFPYSLILDGEIQYHNFSKANINKVWLENELQKESLTAKDVFIGTIDSKGQFFYQKKQL